MQNSSTKSLLLSEMSSFAAAASGFLDEDDLEDAVRFHVMTFVTCSTGSTKALENLHNGQRRQEILRLLTPQKKGSMLNNSLVETGHLVRRLYMWMVAVNDKYHLAPESKKKLFIELIHSCTKIF